MPPLCRQPESPQEKSVLCPRNSRRKHLYERLVGNLRSHFRDPRGEWKFYADEVFHFGTQGHAQSWATVRDLHILSCAAGLQGLIILFDEFEDVITNLNRIDFEEAAFWNLFQFYSGKQFPGMTFFAVTPEFVNKCKTRLIMKGRWDYDYSRFEAIPTFRMSPLEYADLTMLADRIVGAHGQAYEWEPKRAISSAKMKTLVREAASVPVEDRARHAIKTVVKYLDKAFDESE